MQNASKYTYLYLVLRASLVVQTVKNLPAMWVQSLRQEDPFKKGMATHSGIPGRAWQATVHGVTKSQTQLSN